MQNENKALIIEVWDFWKLCPQLPYVINKAVEEGRSLIINYHARSNEDLTQISIVHEMIKQAGIPYQLNIAFLKTKLKTEADYSC